MTAPTLPAAEAAALARIPDCEQVDLLLPDMNGLLRGKRITRSALEKVYADGVCLPMSLIATDITGNTVEETGLGYAIGDEDRICRPVPGTLRPVPWQPEVAWCLGEAWTLDGQEHWPSCPRAKPPPASSRWAAAPAN